MKWVQDGKDQWRLAEDGFSGRAALQQTNQGFVAAISVEEEQFDLELLDEREFFEKEDDARTYLQEKMEQDSY
ncbi:MAG: hypothetical protein SVY41_01555 [Candidatus Nanohaloarchaea archaeon]|nr:hypothetical protein [Candidatus Nanohaloarchaea archaeon]